MMGLLDSILGAASGNTGGSAGTSPLVGVLSGLLAQSGGLPGLAAKFEQAGHGSAFASWIGTGPNQPISPEHMQNVLGSGPVQDLAAKLGIDPGEASQFLAQYLPTIIDKLTPTGKIEPSADHQQGFANLAPSLLQALAGRPAA